MGSRQLEDTRRESRALRLLAAETRTRARATREQTLQGRSRLVILPDPAFPRLHAKMGTTPVIEQAKGILMFQQGCGPEEASGLLLRASQRANVTVHVLAAQLVEHVASGDQGGNVTPISLGATKHLPS